MMQLPTAFVAILFAGFLMAKALPQPSGNYLSTTTIYEEGSSTSTVAPILPAGNGSVHFKEGNDLVERVKRLREDFSNYETTVMVFVSNVNQVLTSFYSDKADNLVELTNYLPSAEKKISRSKCYCEDRYYEPCPQRCINSCYIKNYGKERDCTKSGPSYNHDYEYYCYPGSSRMTGRNVSECYDPPTAEPCSEFAVNQTNLKESYLNFAKLLGEPARIKVRGVERNLKFVRESIRSMETLSDLSWQHCKDPQNVLCFPGMTELIETKVKYYEQLAKNITKELLDTQTEIDRIEGNVHVLTEGAIKQINDSRKNYTCCLRGLNFQVEGVDCVIPTTKAIIQTTQLPPRNDLFHCDDGVLLIPIRKVCDEVYDCMDGSDEARCDI